jgi:hypothetical protein
MLSLRCSASEELLYYYGLRIQSIESQPTAGSECRHSMGLAGGLEVMPCRSTHHSCGDARQVHSPGNASDRSSSSFLEVMPCRSTHHSCGDARQVHSPQLTLAGMCPHVLSLDVLLPPSRVCELLLDKLIPDADSGEQVLGHGLRLSAPPGVPSLEDDDAYDVDEVPLPFTDVTALDPVDIPVPDSASDGSVADISTALLISEDFADFRYDRR